MSNDDRPYRTLGWQLKHVRELLGQTLAEVSGAVEIETDQMQQIEQGHQRPNEDLLMMLISYFGIKDSEADSLWDLAGYTDPSLPAGNDMLTPVPDKAAFATTLDQRVVYTDHMHVMVNKYGVVMNFMQSAGPNQPLPVARVGMSRQHAIKVLEVLKKSLEQTSNQSQPRLLPHPKVKKDKSNG